MEQKTSNKNSIIALCVAVAVIVVALAAYFIISGQKGENQPTVSATMELNTVNIYGAWYKKAGDSTYELRFKDNKELSYKQTAADGTVTAQSDEGAYDIADGKLILTIVAGGQTYSDTCTANVNEKQMSIVADANGSGLFNGIYDKDGADYSVPDISDDEPSEAPDTTSAQTTVAPETTTTTAATTPVPETTAQTTAATTPASETTTTTASVTEAPESKPAENGKIELPESIANYFNTDYEDSEFNGLFAEDGNALGSGYAGYYADNKVVLYCANEGYGIGKAQLVQCWATELFPMLSENARYSNMSFYMGDNFGDKCKIDDNTGYVYLYQDDDYVIEFFKGETDDIDPPLYYSSVMISTIEYYNKERT